MHRSGYCAQRVVWLDYSIVLSPLATQDELAHEELPDR